MSPANDRELAALVFFGILCVVIYRVVLWVMEAKRTADPWSSEVDEAINQQEATPLCHHCLTPQDHNGWFCPRCGATVGPYSNYLPFVYLFSQGEVLRAGVTERLRHTPLIIMGYLLLPLGFFPMLAPLFVLWLAAYLLFFVQNYRRLDTAAEPPVMS
jgi:hypothetical protein